MLFAKNERGQLIEARPGVQGICPSCHSMLIPKCGDVNTWHWAHYSGYDCDSFAEPESAWHRIWKMRFGIDNCEKVIGPHRADVMTLNCHQAPVVIEIQHSPISGVEIEDRETFYCDQQQMNMVWLFDAKRFVDKIVFRKKQSRDGSYWTFRWKWPYKSIWYCQVPVFLDLGNGWIFEIKKIYANCPCGGWGQMHCNNFNDTILRTLVNGAERYVNLVEQPKKKQYYDDYYDYDYKYGEDF